MRRARKPSIMVNNLFSLAYFGTNSCSQFSIVRTRIYGPTLG